MNRTLTGRWLRAALVASILPCAHAPAAPLAVDGSLADWGITVADGNASQLTPSIPVLYHAAEDQSDTAGDGGFVGPNHGGQNYDFEFLGIALQGSRVHLAMVSGLRPDNGFPRFGPGDIRLEINGISYGIEVGGGPGGGPGGVLSEGDPGSTYTLNASGYTTVHAATAAAQVAGSIWLAPTWILDPIPPSTPAQFHGGTHVGLADYVYTRDAVTQQHSVIELSFETGLFGAITSLEVEWGPACGNDVLAGLALFNTPHEELPAPGVLFLLASAFAGMAIQRRRRRATG
ncbi:MAG: hypothetical protein IT529_12720 [Burkholderiales bacterium]|nr:hypothetical protein [Burkholderiales bacterium]